MPLLPTPRQVRHRRRLNLEALEDRVVPSITFSDLSDVSGLTLLDDPSPAEFVAGEILVGFEGDVATAYGDHGPAAALEAAGASVGGLGLHSPSVLAALPEAPGQPGRLATRWLLPEGADVQAMAGRLAELPGVAYAEPNYLVHAAVTYPDDTRFGELWGLDNTGQTGGTPDADIDAPEAWDISTGNSSIVVGVIDSGVDYTHPDLAANMWTNPGEVPDDGIDNDGNGFIDDYRGWDFINNDNDPMDDYSHGTHVSGTIAAAGNNTEGVVGVSWNARIMPLKFLGASGSGPTSAAVEALNYATMMRRDFGVNIRLTNNSWGGGGFSQALHDAIEASGAAGMLFVAAAGNSNRDTDASPNYPSSYDLDNIISVAATDHDDIRADFSNYGATSVDLAAPGVSILSSVPGGGYDTKNGTSMAAPHVAGVAALAWGIAPSASYQVIRDAILDGADPVAGLAGLTATGGRLNAYNTLARVGMNVLASTPAAGDIVTSPPAQFVIEFSFPVDPTSLEAADLTVNSFQADGVTLSPDGKSATFTYSDSPVTAEGVQTMHLADIATTSGVPLDSLLHEWTATFRYDALRLAVLATTPADASLVTLPWTTLSVQFNESIDVLTAGVDDLVLNQGVVVGTEVTGLDNATVEYTLSGLTSEGTLSVVMPAGAVTDANGNPMLAYQGSFELDYGTVPFPAALAPEEPFGSLVYQGAVSGSVRDGSDTDGFTLDLAAGQTVTVVVDPDSNLQPTVEVFDPLGPSLGSASGAAGGPAVLQTIAISTPGVYTVTVDGAAGSTGAYTLQVILNAAVEAEAHGGPANDAIGSAQDLGTAFTPLAGGAERVAVRGTTEGDGYVGPDAFGYTAYPIASTFEENNISSTGTPILAGVDDDEMLLRKSDLNGFEFSLYGTTYTQVIIGSNGQLTFEWQRDSGTILNNYYANRDLTVRPDVAAVAPFWDDLAVPPDSAVYWEVRGSGEDQRLIVQWDRVRFMNTAPDEITFQAILYESDGSIEFNYLNLDHPDAGSAEGASATVGIKDDGAQGGNRLPISLNGGPNRWVGSGLSTRIALGAAPTPSPDFYAFHLDAGQSATLAVTALAGSGVGLEVQDSTGATVAVAAGGPANVHLLIDDLVAPAAGTYYARVTGGLGVEYTLVVTRDAGIDIEGNNDLASAQDVTGKQAILGAVARPDPLFATSGRIELDGPSGLEFGPDGNLYVASWYNGWVHGTGAAVLRYDGVSGVFLDDFAHDAAAHNLPYVEDLTFGPDGNLYVTNDSSSVERYDGTTGEHIDRFASASGFRAKDLVFGPDGNLYVANASGNSVYRFDGTTGAFLGEFVASGSGGLDFPPGLTFGPDGNLYVSSYRNHQILRYDGTTGALLGAFVPAGSGGLNGPWGLLFGPDGNGDGADDLYVASGNSDQILRYDGLTGAFLDVFVSAGSNGLDFPSRLAFGPDDSLYVSGYESDTVLRFGAPLRDTYQLSLAEGATIDLATSTPLGALNGLDPMLRLYDASGSLVASDDNSAADGRNAQFFYSVPTGGGGVYYVEVLPTDQPGAQVGGEYVLTMTPVTYPILYIDDASITEGDNGTKSLDMNVRLSMPVAAEVTVDFATADGTATVAGNDYVAIPTTTLTFAPNVTSQTISITLNGDIAEESHETFFVDLTNASGGIQIANGGRGVGTILNDDTAVSIDDVSIVEEDSGTANAVFTVSLSVESGQAVSVDFTTADGTATTADSDYQSQSGTLTVQPGETSKTITIAVNGDTKLEADESFFVNLTKPASETPGVTISDDQGIGTIVDREAGAPIAPPPGLLSWWTGDGNALDITGPNDGVLVGGATFVNGQVGQAFTFDGVDDLVQAPATLLPTGNDDRTIELWVRVDAFPASGEAYFAGYGNFGSFTQTYHLGTSGDRLFFSQWGSAIFGPSLVADQWYHVAVTNNGASTTLYLDGVPVGSGSFTINTPADTQFYIGRIPGTLGETRLLDGLVDEVSVYNRALTAEEILSIYRAGTGGKIKGPGITVLPASGLQTTEAGGSDTFAVVLDTQPMTDVTIDISSSDTSEGTVDVSSLTFNPSDWNVPQMVTVTGIDDLDTDGDVAYTIVTAPAMSTDPAYQGLDPADVSVTNTDDDAPAGGGGIYVWDIAPDSRTRGRGGSIRDVQVLVTIRRDSDGDGVAEDTDELVTGASVTVDLTDPVGGMDTYAGSTDSSGVFSTGWIRDVPDGNYTAEVTSLSHASYTWDQTLDPTGNDTDDDGDNLPEQTFTLGSPLLAASLGDSSAVQALRPEEVQPLLAEAIHRLAAEGADVSVLAGVQVDITDLDGATLGLAAGNTIVLDADAAGWGWFVDPTPADDSEFTTPGDQGEEGHIDLLTVIAHELGHLLGLEHGDGLMAPRLAPGVRALDLHQPYPAFPPTTVAPARSALLAPGASNQPAGIPTPAVHAALDQALADWNGWSDIALAIALADREGQRS